MQKKLLINLSIVTVILLGTLPFLQLLWNHPFVSGTPDVLVFTGFATSSLQAQAVYAKASHGFFTALQLFPFTFLQGVIMNLTNTLNPLMNFWIIQHLMNFVSTGLFFILGRKITHTTIGGIIAAFVSTIILDIPIATNGGLPRFLSSFQYSAMFFIALLTFFPERQNNVPFFPRLLLMLLSAGVLFSHHHFGVLRLMAMVYITTGLIVASVYFSPFKKLRTVLFSSLHAFLLTILIWTISNITYLSFFFDNFGPSVLTNH